MEKIYFEKVFGVIRKASLQQGRLAHAVVGCPNCCDDAKIACGMLFSDII